MAWIPAPILESVLPDLVDAYTSRMKGALVVDAHPAPVRKYVSFLAVSRLLTRIPLGPLATSSPCFSSIHLGFGNH
jgi:hypothetical protein